MCWNTQFYQFWVNEGPDHVIKITLRHVHSTLWLHHLCLKIVLIPRRRKILKRKKKKPWNLTSLSSKKIFNKINKKFQNKIILCLSILISVYVIGYIITCILHQIIMFCNKVKFAAGKDNESLLSTPFIPSHPLPSSYMNELTRVGQISGHFWYPAGYRILKLSGYRISGWFLLPDTGYWNYSDTGYPVSGQVPWLKKANHNTQLGLLWKVSAIKGSAVWI